MRRLRNERPGRGQKIPLVSARAAPAAARVEVVDLFHFLISLAQVLGMSADDVFQAYIKKNEVNFKRQESGYQEKDHDDSRHI